MRIANKSIRYVAFLFAMGGVPLAPVSVAYAGQGAVAVLPAVPVSSVPATAPSAQPDLSSSLPSLPNPPALSADAPALAPAPVLGMPGLPLQSAQNEVGAPAGGIKKSAVVAEDKVSETAKNVVKNLDSGADAMTLGDINSARQAVARIDAMIDVEKHLAELDKIRNERSGHPSSSASAVLASAIPASALMMPKLALPDSSPLSAPKVVQHDKHKEDTSDIDLVRVSGSDGQYSALLKMGSGKPKPFKVGDHIDDKTTVQKISPLSVVIAEDGKSRTLHIKNVDVIYSATR